MAHIFLYGPPGSGKTTLGKRLADRLQLPFIDLDEALEAASGLSIPELMEQRGESGFRDVESRVLHDQLGRPDTVIALGGGTLLREENRSLAEAHGTIICLTAGQPLLVQRLRTDARLRPLLADHLEAKLAALLGARQSHYESFSKHVDADQLTDEALQQLQIAAGRFHLSAMSSYDVIVEPGSLDRIGEMLRDRGISRLMLVSDSRVSRLYSERVLESVRRYGNQCGMLVVGGGESCKTLETVSRLWDGFLQGSLDRKSMAISLGGGVVSDLAGFAASTFMRGIDWICVPTTLLSMVDASLGGKTGFDLPDGKNLIGSFHAPQLVLTDPEVLGSLPQAEFRAGLAEMVKHGIVADPGLFRACAGGLASIQKHLVGLIRRAVAVKVHIIERDPYETGERAALNFGHTIGHAIELVSGFSIPHGEAVAMGMVAEGRLAERLTIARRGLAAEIAAVLTDLGLPVEIPHDLRGPGLAHAMRADKKKASGVVHFTLPIDIGRVQTNVAVRELETVLEEA